MTIPLQDISIINRCKYFTLFLFISLNLKCLFTLVEGFFFDEIIYNGIFSLFFALVFYFALVFIQYFKQNILSETILKKDSISYLMQQIVTVSVFFAVVFFPLDRGSGLISNLIPFFNDFQWRDHFYQKFILDAVIVFNYFIIFNYIRFDANKRGVKLDYKSFSQNSYIKRKSNDSRNNQLSIYGLSKDEVVHMKADDFIFAKSEGHYLKVYYFLERNNTDNKKIRSILIRNSLKKLSLDVFKDFEHIARVQKSYIINYNYVENIRILPNNKGGTVSMSFLNINIPVSVTKIDDLNAYMLINNIDIPIYN